MSDAMQQEQQAPVELSILDQLRAQHHAFVNQRDEAQVNLQQLIGAIYACELMIKKHEDEADKCFVKEPGEECHVEADQQESQEAPHE